MTEEQLADYISALTNGVRIGQNTSSLKKDEIISEFAREHSREMAKRGQLGHEGWYYRQAQIAAKIPVVAIGENVGSYKGEAEVVGESLCRMWRSSPRHFHNMIGDYTLIGLGVTLVSTRQYFVCQIFAKN